MNGKRILLIEGEEKIAVEIGNTLIAQHYKTDLAFNGSIGKQFFRTHSYDLALVDLHLPDMSGCELSYYIRRRDVQIPLIMFSSGVVDDHKFEGFEAGIDDYVILSGDFRELLVRIHTLIKRPPRACAEHNRIESGDIVLDLNSKEVIRGCKTILLTAKEFLLLEYLVRHKNRIVSREEIVCSIWGSGCSDKGERVAVYMNSLRKKMEDGTFKKCIYTVTGKGYLLAENL